MDAVTFRVARYHVERAQADGSGRAKNRQPARGTGATLLVAHGPPAINPSASTTGRAKGKIERSMTPKIRPGNTKLPPTGGTKRGNGITPRGGSHSATSESKKSADTACTAATSGRDGSTAWTTQIP